MDNHEARSLLISAFNTLRPEPTAVETWANALRSGDFKFGYGVLRDGDDCYDPMGVLAATNLVDWTWNETEGVWSVAGKVDYLPDNMILRFLGCDRADAMAYTWAGRLGQTIAALNDSAADFDLVAGLLTAALPVHQQEVARMRSAILETRPHTYSARGDDMYIKESQRGRFYASSRR